MKQTMTCPKCGTEQEISRQCINCEIFFEKYYQSIEMQSHQVKMAGADIPKLTKRQPKGRHAVDRNENADMLKALAAAAVAALVGAWLWKFVAVTFEYELAFIAWGIGGLIGFVAASMGGRGLVTGVLCALLAAGSILGGKYMAVDAFRTDLVEMLSNGGELGLDGFDEELADVMDEMKADARVFASLGQDESSLRKFMIDHDYSVAYAPQAVSEEELEVFREFEQPNLLWIAQNNPTYQEWMQHSMGIIEDISVVDTIKTSFGIFDLLFLFLGVVTAFRLGSGGEYEA